MRKLQIFTYCATVLFGMVAAMFYTTPVAAQTTCGTTTTPATTLGQVTQTVSVATAGTYRVWSRIKTSNTTNNSYYLQIDGGCAINVGDAAIAANVWTWVNYQGGASTNIINVSLTAGTHTLKYTGKEGDVLLDRVILTADTACVPTGTGDNCATADSTIPTVSVSLASASTQFEGTQTATAIAADNVGVTKVEFYTNGNLRSTDTTAPYSFTWTTDTNAGTKTVYAKAYDAANNVAQSTTVSFVNGTTAADTTPPAVGIQVSPTTVTSGSNVTATATATDNVGVTKVEFYENGVLKGTDTTTPYSATWVAATAGSRTVTAKAFDSAGNATVSSAAIITVTTIATVSGDANNDAKVNAIDYSLLVSHDGQAYPQADFDKDGVVGAADLALLLANWTW